MWPDPSSLPDLSSHQRDQFALATHGFLGILAGRPGTGKTFTVAAAIRSLAGRRVAVAAPTGKAAVRATESLARAGCDVKATTIHRLLRVASCEGGGWTFEHHEQCPLPFDFVFIDEASMIDTPLMASLLAARPAGCRVLLVGDPGQLSPVGHGAPLRDMIAAGLPCGHLTEIRRNSGRIVECCKEIAEKSEFCSSRKMDLEAGENLVHVERPTGDSQIIELRTFLDRIRAGGKYDPIEDVQVLVAVNAKSPLARKTINRDLQVLLNPNGERAGANPFRAGDKIVCLSNGWVPAGDDDQDEANEDGKIYVANGEQARVERVAENYTVAKLKAPDRLVLIPRGENGGGDSQDSDDEAKTDTGCNWDLAYGISVHKSQGSEWPIVIYLVDSYAGAVRLVDRHHIYTGISRAKTLCVTIGRLSILRDAVRKSHMWKRKTFLKETIEDLRLLSVEQAFEEAMR